MGRLGGTEILLILLIALLLFGPSKLADMGKGLGEGLKNFKKGLSPEDEAKPPPAPPPPQAKAAAPAAAPPAEQAKAPEPSKEPAPPAGT
jgi:sec-independent protein translocase protein TatA